MHDRARRLRAISFALLISASLVATSVASVSADLAGAPWPKARVTAPPLATTQDLAGAPWPR